jgi:comEA protein
MRLLEKFNNTFGFTPMESKVVLFLIAMFVLGIAVKTFQPDRRVPRFDYRVTDSVFAARSEMSGTSRAHTSASPETARVTFGGRQKKLPAVVDINSAAIDDLVALPGIGASLAERILLYREENGPFQSIEELMNVKGIGKKKFEQLLPYCRLGK